VHALQEKDGAFRAFSEGIEFEAVQER
jgi:hypothetical protein